MAGSYETPAQAHAQAMGHGSGCRQSTGTAVLQVQIIKYFQVSGYLTKFSTKFSNLIQSFHTLNLVLQQLQLGRPDLNRSARRAATGTKF